MSTLGANDSTKNDIETKVIEELRKRDYTLNTINSYGENLLHTSAANGCARIAREILGREEYKHVVDRKNKFGWTPLMLAIRNKDITTVKYLLKKNSNTNESTYLGMSVLGLAAAINREMFEIVYNSNPKALENAINDDITPLCIAALKNDKELFFRLVELGFQPSKANEYTQVMMRQSTVPEISSLARERLEIDDYWNDTKNNIALDTKEYKNYINHSNIQNEFHKVRIELSEHREVQSRERKESFAEKEVKQVFAYEKESFTRPRGILKQLDLNLLAVQSLPKSMISPRFSCSVEEAFPNSPNILFTEKTMETAERRDSILDTSVESVELGAPVVLQRLQSIRPPDLNIERELNTTIGYTPQFSPLRSPQVPADITDENVFGEHTPTPPRYRTPPRGMILNSEEMKMFILLKRYGLGHLAPIFLKQEVDVELFLILSEADLAEIGIEREAERAALLEAIADCRRIASYYEA